ncbi:hypothetical protein GIS00_15075 [Nakamurella sp. YIM 132087]|uniref:Uncharacterized protein n=1 Tax=Nakamurella alba TaxID=2665158 RepID=A0A7K1FPU2_9ACTN|nr:hypothetical protein [Nakamurella alba]MTD15263.1 hypothetical protein [Nakamurella alba]
MTLLLAIVIALPCLLIGAVAGYSRGVRDLNAVDDARTMLPAQRAPELRLVDDLPSMYGLQAAAYEYFTERQIISGDSDTVEIQLREVDIQLYPTALQSFLDQLGFPSSVLDRMARTRTLDGFGTADGMGCTVSWTYRLDGAILLDFQSKVAA